MFLLPCELLNSDRYHFRVLTEVLMFANCSRTARVALEGRLSGVRTQVRGEQRDVTEAPLTLRAPERQALRGVKAEHVTSEVHGAPERATWR